MNYHLELKNPSVFAEIDLPTSKSISNRLLIIRALSDSKFNLEDLSQSNDTLLMQRALDSSYKIIDVEDAGTCMRFLAAYYAFQKGEKIIQCSESMKKRPIGILVEALKSLGAKIKYLEEDSYPPLLIEGTEVSGNQVDLFGGISSQFVSALLLVAPILKKGLILNLKGKLVSMPYIQMTLSLLKEFGISYQFKDNAIIVKSQKYKYYKDCYTIEGDWSAASYWYSMLALAKNGKIFLKNLKQNSIQGDSILIKIFKKLGINSKFENDGVLLKKKNVELKQFNYNFSAIPDLAQTIAVCCSFLDIPFSFTGLETLKIKETNRVNALITELKKFGYILLSPSNGQLVWDGKKDKAEDNIEVETYLDHRMAMAFAPIVMHQNEIKIKDAKVVKKSYPTFWNHLHDIGIICNEYG